MKSPLNIFFLFSSIMLTMSCSSDGSTSETDVDTGEGQAMPPSTVSLIFPENNTECNEGLVLNNLQSRVIFTWSEAENTDSYRLDLTNLNTGEESSINTINNEAPIVLDRGVPYEWSVSSLSRTSEQQATSVIARFYNQGPGVENYAPFPPSATTPENGEMVNVDTDGVVTLQWTSSDIDDDITSYIVFLDTNDPPTNAFGEQTENNRDVSIARNTAYYWRVLVLDQHGNSSSSQVFHFSTNP